MLIFPYSARGGDANNGFLEKGPLEKTSYQIDVADGLPSGVTLTSAVTVATDDAGATVTTTCVGSTTTSGTLITVNLLTFGTAGTGAAVNGLRVQLKTTATLSAGTLVYQVMARIDADTYDPI